MELTDKQYEWAVSQLGKIMRSQMGGYNIVAGSFEPGSHGRGIWFYDTHQGYKRVYKPIPKRLLTDEASRA